MKENFREVSEDEWRTWMDEASEHKEHKAELPFGVQLTDFVAYMPMHSYIFKPAGQMWPARSVNARIPPITTENGKQTSASAWLDINQPVEQMTWAPGEAMEIKDRLISDGGWIARPGCTVFNLYRAPMLTPCAGNPGKWIEHAHRLFGDNATHVIRWLAHRVQRPQQKINHALVLGGAQGIGKDTLLEPVKRAIGPWNFSEVTPQQVLGRFNGFLKSVILRVSEARDLGEFDRFGFYDHMKSYTAAPPDVLRVDEKHIREHSVVNVCGVIITTNHKADGIFLPADDRRHFVGWCDLVKENFSDKYWNDLYHWYDHGGDAVVAGYLANLDLASFNPKAPPPKTAAFWEIVDASRAPEDAELADILDTMKLPAALTLVQVINHAPEEFAEWLRDRRNARRIPHRLEECGYVAVRNNDAKDGLWKVAGRRQVIYAKADLSLRDRLGVADRLARGK